MTIIKRTTIRDVVLIHVRASGPVSGVSLVNYCKQQVPGDVDDFQVAEAVTELVREGAIRIGDDCQTFDLPG